MKKINVIHSSLIAAVNYKKKTKILIFKFRAQKKNVLFD